LRLSVISSAIWAKKAISLDWKSSGNADLLPFITIIGLKGSLRLEGLSTKAWVRDARECWDRSIQLCLMLGNGAGKQLKEIENSFQPYPFSDYSVIFS
jgi:hypothetical protein